MQSFTRIAVLPRALFAVGVVISVCRITAEAKCMEGVQTGLLKADDGRAATVDEGLQVWQPSSEATHIPLEQIPDEWRGKKCMRKRNSAPVP
jgi:hypothetical protein